MDLHRIFKNIFSQNVTADHSRTVDLRVGARTPSRRSPIGHTAARLESMLKLTTSQIQSGRHRLPLYRFLSDNLPLVGACIWTWSRLAAAPGRYRIVDSTGDAEDERALERLDNLAANTSAGLSGQPVAMTSLLVELFQGLFRDGMFGGFVTVKSDGSGVDRFVPIDAARLHLNEDNKLLIETDSRAVVLDRPDFYLLALNESADAPLGRSVLRTIPFVSWVEQQLLDDMRRASHNAGFHRLHVRITPPERLGGESDKAYVDRINTYFDDTVRMIRSCDVDENPVTWDNVQIESIGPKPGSTVTANWYLSHRALVEQICAATNLAPFMLGYSYGSTRTWATFKFDLVMRQVRSVQAEASRFLSWLGDIDLALGGYESRCEWVFDNAMTWQADQQTENDLQRVEAMLKLYAAGLVDEDTARRTASRLVK